MAELLKQLFRRGATRSMSSAQIRPKENVADYPRPPKLERTPRHLRVLFNGATLADTRAAYRVLETHHPPTYYLPPQDCDLELIKHSPGGETSCEWKGSASYFDVVPAGGAAVRRRIWAYPNPTDAFKPIAGYLSFYASPFECFVDGERVDPQPGNFYGGWKTSEIEGPIKGGPGTWGW
jgi:uncharacterized protein (DUF427 family)